jgi:hypothetical protein
MTKNHYVYYSYEEWGRGYIGVRSTEVNPHDDKYLGSFKDKTFKPTQKIVIAIFKSRKEALYAEVALHNFYQVDKNPHFANISRQTSTGFTAPLVSPMLGKKHRASTIHKIKTLAEERYKNKSNRDKLSSCSRGKVWWNNGVTETRAEAAPDSGFVRGRLNHSSKVSGVNNPFYGKKHSEESRKKISGENNPMHGKRWWNNGTERKASKECPGQGWLLGRGWVNRV